MKTQKRAILLAAFALSACAASENPATDGVEALEAAESVVVGVLADKGPAVLSAPGSTLRATETSAHDGGKVVYQFGDYEGGNARAAFVIRWTREAGNKWRADRSISAPMAAPPVLLAVMKPARSGGAPLDDDIARNEVNQRMAELAAAVNQRDGQRMAGFWTDDAQFFQPDVQLTNQDAKTGFNNGRASTRGQQIEFTPRDNFVHDDGNVVYQFGTFTVGDAQQHQYLARLRRNSNGVWLIDRFLSAPGQ